MVVIEEMLDQPEDRQIIIPSEDWGDYVKMPNIQHNQKLKIPKGEKDTG